MSNELLRAIKISEELEHINEQLEDMRERMRALTGMMGLLNANVYRGNENARVVAESKIFESKE